MTIDPVNVTCPHCGLRSSHYVIMSGTIFRSEVYTDGRLDVISGMHGHNPFLLKCRRCKGFYIYRDATSEADRSKTDNEFESLENEEYHLQAADFFDALREITAFSREDEIAVRLLFWRSVNDIIRWKGQDEASIREYLRWNPEMRQNLERIIGLMEEEMCEDYLFPLVEICRELGQFDKARDYLKKIPGGRNATFVSFQKALIKKGDTGFHKLPSNENI